MHLLGRKLSVSVWRHMCKAIVQMHLPSGGKADLEGYLSDDSDDGSGDGALLATQFGKVSERVLWSTAERLTWARRCYGRISTISVESRRSGTPSLVSTKTSVLHSRRLEIYTIQSLLWFFLVHPQTFPLH